MRQFMCQQVLIDALLTQDDVISDSEPARVDSLRRMGGNCI
jgi:hypothetical protein